MMQRASASISGSSTLGLMLINSGALWEGLIGQLKSSINSLNKTIMSPSLKEIIKSIAFVTATVLFWVLLCTMDAKAQEITRVGNTFISTKVSKQKAEPQKTKFEWQDSEGQKYPIYIGSTGSCFVIKVSKKTGKEYRQYLGAEISEAICKELGIEYKPRSQPNEK